MLFRAACRGHGRCHGSPLDGVSLDLGRSAKVSQGELTPSPPPPPHTLAEPSVWMAGERLACTNRAKVRTPCSCLETLWPQVLFGLVLVLYTGAFRLVAGAIHLSREPVPTWPVTIVDQVIYATLYHCSAHLLSTIAVSQPCRRR